jgi:type III secretion protein V
MSLLEHLNIWYLYTVGTKRLEVFLLDSASVESKLRDVVQYSERQQPVDDFKRAGEFLRQFRRTVRKTHAASTAVLLTTTDLRPHVKRLIAAQFPAIPVASYQELAPDLSIIPIGRIKLT